MTQPTETWRPIPDWEGLYEVSDLGRVRSLDRTDSSGKRRRGRILRGTVGAGGYVRVNLSRNSQPVSRTVHSLVLEAFIGPRPDRFEACHGPGGPTDNRIWNLRWDTSTSNNMDIVQAGNHNQSQKTHCPRGHDYVPANLSPHDAKLGYRRCRSCARERANAHYAGRPFDSTRADHLYAEAISAT